MKKIVILVCCLFLIGNINLSAASNSINDEAGLLSTEEIEEIQEKIDDIEDRYDISVAILTGDEYYAGDIRVWASDFYDYGDYKSDGLIFGINMANREYVIVSSGNIQDNFDSSAIDELLDLVNDEMVRGDYAGAILSFLDESAYFLANPDRINHDYLMTMLISSLVVAAIITIVFIVATSKSMKMKSLKHEATNYIEAGSLKLNKKRDLFLYTTMYKTKINKSSGSSSSGSFRGSSGVSHTGGSRGF